jgi:hypothetical protein
MAVILAPREKRGEWMEKEVKGQIGEVRFGFTN